MELKSIQIKPWSREFRNIRRLLLTQFPRDELYSIFGIRLATIQKNIDCSAFYDGDRFVGFCYLLTGEKTVFLLYTATDPELQSKGYGSGIQKAIQERYAGREIVCHIERPKNFEDPADQKNRRLRFYERNGYAFTGYRTADNGVEYWVLSTRGKDFDRAAYEKLFYDREGEKGVPKLEKAENPADRA